MRVLSRCMSVVALVIGVLAALISGVVPASAQCAMMGGSGHGSGASHGARVARPSVSDKKLRATIDRLLSDERGRVLLTDALLEDQAIREAFVQRLAANPKWRVMASQQLSDQASLRTDGADSRVVPRTTQVVYACPMHSDVTSPAPGSCSKCGMALVRRDLQRE